MRRERDFVSPPCIVQAAIIIVLDSHIHNN
jgi:hypothetical protein